MTFQVDDSVPQAAAAGRTPHGAESIEVDTKSAACVIYWILGGQGAQSSVYVLPSST
jgi:hypothetical protein